MHDTGEFAHFLVAGYIERQAAEFDERIPLHNAHLLAWLFYRMQRCAASVDVSPWALPFWPQAGAAWLSDEPPSSSGYEWRLDVGQDQCQRIF